MRIGRMVRPITILAAVVAIGMATLIGAGTADATVYRCTVSGTAGLICANVTAIDPGSVLRQHQQPNYTSAVNQNTHYTNGVQLLLLCWTTGSGDIDGHGDHYWFKVDDGIIAWGYVNDWYVNTGSYAQWSPYVRHC